MFGLCILIIRSISFTLFLKGIIYCFYEFLLMYLLLFSNIQSLLCVVTSFTSIYLLCPSLCKIFVYLHLVFTSCCNLDQCLFTNLCSPPPFLLFVTVNFFHHYQKLENCNCCKKSYCVAS